MNISNITSNRVKKTFYLFVIGGFFISLMPFVSAASIFDITYPISELGGCESQQACKVYCDDSANKDACLSFAEKYGLVAKEKIEEAKKLPALGPGGCRGPEECRGFCDKPDNEEACFAFAEKYGMKVQGARGQDVSAQARLIKEQGGPGNCQSQKECYAYCENPAHQGECFAFAEKHNLIDKKEMKAAKKVMEQGGPGGCRAEKECRAFCDNPENLEVCLAFAEENELMPKEEIAKAKRMAGKPGPGGCLGRQCEEFCRKQENQETCFQFAVENNLIPPEEIERAKKMKRIAEESGPGGCRGERECRAYCDNPEHSDECFSFAKQNGLIDEKEIKMMERGEEMKKKVMEAGGPGGCRGEEECRAYCENPDHVEECLAFAVEQGGVNVDDAKGMLEKFARAGMNDDEAEFEGREMRPGMPPMPFNKQFEERFQKFEQFRELEGQFRKPPEMMQDFRGPGGCQGPDECIKYCFDPAHRAECARLNPSVGGLPPGDIFKQAEPGSASEFRPGFERVPTPFSHPTSPDALRVPFLPLNTGMIRPPMGAEEDRPIAGDEMVCTQEYRPVCGANNRTYPNECFAKRDNISVIKSGPCGMLNFERPAGIMPSPEGIMPPEGIQPPPGGLPAQSGENFIPQYTQPPITPEQQFTPPQSRRVGSSLLSNLLQAFSNALRMR